MRYTVTSADRRPLPTAFVGDPRRLGYSDADRDQPYAAYFRPKLKRLQDHVFDALAAGERPSAYAYTTEQAAARMSRPGYEAMETGIATLPDGRFMVAIHTLMPRVTAEMWDWWFAWHGHDSARYKLWHPEAHMACAMAEDRRGRDLPWSRQYIDNTCHVAEYIGGRADDLSIRFVDPASLGFRPAPNTVVICGRTGPTDIPIGIGWAIHQVRPIEGGCEMRSRFFLNDVSVIDLPRHSVGSAAGRLLSGLPSKVLGPALGKLIRVPKSHLGIPLLVHCAEEMNHLSAFLPELFNEFRNSA